MSKHASPTVIGAFVVTALALVVAAILVLGGTRYFHTTAKVVVYFDGSVAGLRVGAPVKFRGIEIGAVKDVRISMTTAVRNPQHVRIRVLLKIDEDRLSAQGIRRVDLDDRAQVDQLVAAGLRAALDTESLVTGVRYIALDVRPDTPIVLSHDPTYPEIPSVRGVREVIPEKANEILTKLAAVDVARLADSLQATIDDTDKLLRSPGLTRAVARLDEITKHAEVATAEVAQAVHELKTTAGSANKLIAPNGQVSSQLDATLREVQAAARSLRRLSDQLGRDPGAVLRGGKQ